MKLFVEYQYIYNVYIMYNIEDVECQGTSTSTKYQFFNKEPSFFFFLLYAVNHRSYPVPSSLVLFKHEIQHSFL